MRHHPSHGVPRAPKAHAAAISVPYGACASVYGDGADLFGRVDPFLGRDLQHRSTRGKLAEESISPQCDLYMWDRCIDGGLAWSAIELGGGFAHYGAAAFAIA